MKDFHDIFDAILLGDNDKIERAVLDGFDVNTRDDEGFSLLANACYKNNKRLVKFLIAHGADIKGVTASGNGVFHIACRHASPEIIDMFLSRGLKVDRRTRENKYTGLMQACGHGNAAAVAFLLSRGADINAKNKNGSAPLNFACHAQNEDIVRMLLKNGADASVINNDPYSRDFFFKISSEDEFNRLSSLKVTSKEKDADGFGL